MVPTIPRKWQPLISIGGALLLAPQPGIPADDSVQFSGSLEAVTHHTLSILLQDGRIVDARILEDGELSAQSLFGKYRMGDLVEIKGRPRKPTETAFPFRDEETGIVRNLDLEQIGFVRSLHPPNSTSRSALEPGCSNRICWQLRVRTTNSP